MALITHPDLTSKLRSYNENLPQGLLLTGVEGVGLGSLARSFTGKYALHAVIEPRLLTKTSTIPKIGIDRIRELYLASRGKQAEPSAIIIDDADRMTENAQNAFLKLLEEPAVNLHFILTTHSPEKLLPTVLSRLQTLYIRPISEQQSVDLVTTLPGLDEVKRRQLLFIANGLPAELYRLAHDSGYFTTRSSRIKLAKELAEGASWQRLATLFRVSPTREEAIALIKQLIALLEISPEPSKMRRVKKLLLTLEHLEKGGNIRLQLTAGVL